MNFHLSSLSVQSAAAIKSDALLVLVSSEFKPETKGLSAFVGQLFQEGDLEHKPGKWVSLLRSEHAKSTRVVVAATGDGSAQSVRTAVNAAIASLRCGSAKVKSMVVCFAAEPSAGAIRSAVLAVAESSYVYTATKSKPEGRVLSEVTLGTINPERFKLEFEKSVATVSGVELAKEWANRPANHATPSLLAQAARSLSRWPRISCEVLGIKEVTKLGMGSFLSVGQGSSEPLKFIVLNYSGAAKSVAPTVLIGKGITFDTGGISLKPAAEMDEMKFDMCGAASVLGVFRSLGELQPAVNVVGLIPSCENMPGGRSIKPGDVVTSMSGQTIEILNTDAEGRLILCDALTYAERFKPRAVVDIATLTGACVIALGAVRSGLFSTKDELAADLTRAGDSANDLCWRMPLDEEYAEGLKTNFADVANVAGRAAGAITAAKFLQRFSSKFAWAHLDIAGTAWKSGAAKGATGRPVGLLLEYLMNSAAQTNTRATPAKKAKRPAKA